MGYTNYWYQTADVDGEDWQRLTAICTRIVDLAAQDGIMIRGARGIDEPVIDNEVISFNGRDIKGDDLSYETMTIERKYIDSGVNYTKAGFNCCKTARRPYDVVVKACLVAAVKLTHGVIYDISSDDPLLELSQAWSAGVALYDGARKTGLHDVIADHLTPGAGELTASG